MSNLIEVSIIGRPSDAQRPGFKQAKAQLRITEPMVFVPAVPGRSRVIVFGQDDQDYTPDFACEWITLYHSDPQDILDTLAWYLGRQDDWRAAGIELWLERAMGAAPVREVA